MASTAEAAREFLKIHETSFSDTPPTHKPYGSYWKFMKKVCMLEFLGGKMLHQLLHVRQTHDADQQRDIDDDDEAEAEALRKVGEDTVELSGKFNVSDFLWFMKGVDIPQIFLMMSRGNAHFVLL
ncbi:hypothetical protein HN51_067667 [Arachis hypogaea]|uniref:Uncharacterized protein n=1 Tax=Arachis hypogaea TaxID=3818 RepID=A0A444ZQ66_ARAHY|nr:hypothetical protein Ahy_B04g073336 [Arachis hypogaea]